MGEIEGQIPDWILDEGITAENKCQLSHMFETFSTLHKLQKEGSLCDITINVDDTSFQAHKVVLASCSVYFKAMFSSGFQESHQAEVNINGKSEAFQILLDFAYSGQLTLSMETVIDVLQMAHYLQFDNVMERCTSFLTYKVGNQRVDVVDAINILSVADMYGVDKLKKPCKEYIAKNFTISDDILQHMTIELMEEVLQRNDLTSENHANEKEVFDTTLAWLQHDWENRQVHAPALLQRIRLGLIPIGHLTLTALSSFPDLYAIPECKDMIDNVLKLVDANKPSDPPLYYSHPNLFTTRTTISAVLSLGTDNYYYSVNKARWLALKKFPSLPEKDCKAKDSFITAQGKLYVARGTLPLQRTLECPQFLSLDTCTPNSKWHTLAPMMTRREYHPLVQAYVGGSIYAIGGNENDSQSCEAYSIRENTWRAIAPMCRRVFSVRPGCAAALNGKIFVYAPASEGIGHEHSHHHLQMYDPVQNFWFLMATFRHPTTSVVPTGLTVRGGKLYRIVDANCRCTLVGCKWRHLRVDELVIDVANKTAVVGENQNQAVIPEQFRDQVIRINQNIFVIYEGNICRTDMQIASNQNQVDKKELTRWRNLSRNRFLTCSSDRIVNSATFFKFDCKAWM